MRERPILFSTAMVQAILDGRKSMTRRVVTNKYFLQWTDDFADEFIKDPDNDWLSLAPYKPGDILWVRETWRATGVISEPYAYKADEEILYLIGEEGQTLSLMYKWRPSIHMPREAARLFLRVKNVRVERLQDILCGDMKREGCIPATVTGGQYQQRQREYWIPLWDSTIKIQDISRYGWDANPWVWVIEFEKVSP